MNSDILAFKKLWDLSIRNSLRQKCRDHKAEAKKKGFDWADAAENDGVDDEIGDKTVDVSEEEDNSDEGDKTTDVNDGTVGDKYDDNMSGSQVSNGEGAVNTD